MSDDGMMGGNRAMGEDVAMREGLSAVGATREGAARPDAPSALDTLQSGTMSDAARVLRLHTPRTRRAGNRRRTLMGCVIGVALLIAIAVVGYLLRDAAMATDLSMKNLAPSFSAPFGTDNLGRNMLLRTLSGLSTSIGVGLLAAGCSSIIALVLGTLSALLGRTFDAVVTWLIDLMMGIPHIVLLLLISFALGKGFWGVTIGVAVTHWPSLCRVIRAEVLQVRQSTYVAAARKLGQSPWHIALRHMVPAVLPQFLVGLILMFPHAILHEAAITFLGFGLPPEMPAIGVILSESMSYLSTGMWWLAFFPGVALVLVVLVFDRVGEGIRRILEPASAQD